VRGFSAKLGKEMRTIMRMLLVCLLALGLVGVGSMICEAADNNGNWSKTVVYQLNGKAKPIPLPGEYQLASKDWPKPAMVPYLAYMPEKDRVAMLLYGVPAISFSDDHGATWSVPKSIPGAGLTLTYLGNGTLLSDNMVSHDYGETWEALPKQTVREVWLPSLVDRDPKTGKVTRLAKAFWSPIREWGTLKTGAYAQGYISFSYDEGKTWQDEVKVPQWLKVSEIALARAKNGDMVAACRLDLNDLLDPTAMDNYTGTGVSISKDNGKTWSDPHTPKNTLFDWGRTHMWLETMPDGDMIMSYNVRRGYPDAPGGYPQFGAEAVVSHDNGRTWDIDHRYILHVYEGNVPARDFWSFQGATSNASTAILPDGTLLTAFNMEYTKIGLVKWKLNDKGVNKDKTYAKAPYDSVLRNEFDPAILTGKQVKPTGRRNVAMANQGAKVSGTHSDYDPVLVLANPYLYSQFPPGVTFDSSPAVVEITWPKRYKVDEVQILTGDPNTTPGQDMSRVPLDYQLEYRKGEKWINIVPPVQNAVGQAAFTWQDEQKKDNNTYAYLHKFSPVETDGIRLTITKATNSPTGRVFLRRIEVWGD